MSNLPPHHQHNEPDPYGKIEEAHAPYEHMRSLRNKAHAVLHDLIKYSAGIDGAGHTNDAARAAYDAVSDIIVGEPE